MDNNDNDIELVIKIPEVTYKSAIALTNKKDHVIQLPIDIISNGILLPKEHQWLTTIIKALEKDIPKPISIENGFVKCNTCGMYIRLPIADHYNNCPECGQKILWVGDTES